MEQGFSVEEPAVCGRLARCKAESRASIPKRLSRGSEESPLRNVAAIFGTTNHDQGLMTVAQHRARACFSQSGLTWHMNEAVLFFCERLYSIAFRARRTKGFQEEALLGLDLNILPFLEMQCLQSPRGSRVRARTRTTTKKVADFFAAAD